jgi:hypothetical protein
MPYREQKHTASGASGKVEAFARATGESA